MVDKQKETEERAKRVKELGTPVTFNGKKIGKGEKITLEGGGHPTTLLLMGDMRKEGRFDDLN